MVRIRAGWVLTLAFVLCAPKVDAQPKDKKPEPLIGSVFIVGNTITKNRVILDALDLYPGAKLQLAKLPVAERKLADLGLFKVDPKKGIRPTVAVLDTPGQFKDILVKVEERSSTVSFKPVFAVSPPIGLGIAFVLEERNFDPCRLPSTLVDFLEGNAFRGAGQKLQVGIAVGILSGPRMYLALKD